MQVGINLGETQIVSYPLEYTLRKTKTKSLQYRFLYLYFSVLEMSVAKSYLRQKTLFSRDSLILRPAERSGRAYILQGSRS